MPAISVLVKPSSSSCNLRCKYCFYHDVASNRDVQNFGMMDLDTLEIIIKRVLDIGEHFVSFMFQGGEPTLVGLDFFRKLVVLQNKYNIKNIKIMNSIQTNGLLIDEEWAKFLMDNNFLVGLSLDGAKDIHDLNRIDLRGKGSHKEVEKTVRLLNRFKVEYNILCVVTNNVARHTEKVYKYYSKKGFNYLQFIPCLDELDEKTIKNPYSLSPEMYGNFLKRLFDLWYQDYLNENRISIRMFDNIISVLRGYVPESCDMRGSCSPNIVIESNGSVYPCDFYVIDKWKLGNIKDDNILDIYSQKRVLEFLEVSKDISNRCSVCEYFFVCKGGCRRHYEPIGVNREDKNYFCNAYKEFYEYSLPRFYHIIRTQS